MRDGDTAWVLLGRRQGDNNQARALAALTGLAVVEKKLRFTRWRFLPRWFGRAAALTVDRATRRALAPPWPAVVIGTGKRSVPLLGLVARRSGGAARTVAIGDPRSPPRWFDLVVTTPQYRVPAANNVLRLPLPLPWGIARHDGAAAGGPVLLVGGASWPWRVDAPAVLAAATRWRDAGTVALTGQRTPRALRRRLRDVLGPDRVDAVDYRAALASGGSFLVTADSASMLGDAIQTGRPVTMLPAAAGPLGRAWVAAWRLVRPRAPLWPRDLPRLWASLRATGLVDGGGADPPDTTALVAERLRLLLARPSPTACKTVTASPARGSS